MIMASPLAGSSPCGSDADAEAEAERDIERLLGDFDARLEAVQRRLDRVLDRRA